MYIAIVRGLIVLWAASFALVPAQAAEPRIYRDGQPVVFEDLIRALSTSDVVLVGEQHGFEAGHAFEARLVAELSRARAGLALSLEMFETDVQLVLDEYLQGHITESAFLAAARPWPRYKTDYRPMVEFCRENRIPVIAANVPRRYVNAVSRNGQSALLRLPRPSRAFLPKLPYSMDISAAYDAELTQMFTAPHGTTSSPGMPSAENMKQAQGLWDHGMAESIIRALRRRDVSAVLHVCGSMHCERGFGIVERLRKASHRLRIATVILRPTPADGSPLAPNLGDFIVDCGP
ncbi:MAG: ChaN family lipoprotein [Chthonomonadales bacterium]|nr:ChaN family lipoprotein [Chthonomonadales bacterium]